MSLAAKHRALREQMEQERIAMQLACTHDGVVYEHAYRAEGSLPAQPPWRVCETCGFSEEGWSCGFQILTGKVEENIEAAREHRVGWTHPNHKFVRMGDIRHKPTLYKMAIEEGGHR